MNDEISFQQHRELSTWTAETMMNQHDHQDKWWQVRTVCPKPSVQTSPGFWKISSRIMTKQSGHLTMKVCPKIVKKNPMSNSFSRIFHKSFQFSIFFCRYVRLPSFSKVCQVKLSFIVTNTEICQTVHRKYWYEKWNVFISNPSQYWTNS